MKNNRIYISGAITGTTDYLERFAAAEEKLRVNGWDVINTTKVGEALPKLTWEEYMRVDFAFIALCDSIFILNNSEKSVGVSCEREIAEHCEMSIFEESDGVPVFESEVIKNA